MEIAVLNGRRTSCLGFGCSLLGTTSDAVSRKLLSTAFEAGIRHFDVAPMYGFGRSERLLSEALGSRLQEATITTKYGLNPPPHSRWIGPFHRLAKRAVTLLPSLDRRKPVSPKPTEQSSPPLTAKEAQRSIEASLRELKVDTIDLLLLHEATPARLQDVDLLDVLLESRQAGKIRGFGVGSRSERVAACLVEAPQFCELIQFEWSVFSPVHAELEGRPRINHGSLGNQRASFVSWLRGNSERCRRWSEAVQVDLQQARMMERLMLKASLIHNAGHIVLFSTRSPENIRQNVATAEDRSLDAPARAFHELVRREASAFHSAA